MRSMTLQQCRRLLLVGTLACLCSVGCGRSHYQRFTTQQLASAPVAPMEVPQFGPLSDPSALGSLYTQLGPRLGLVQVHTASEWRRLRAVAPWLADEPLWDTGGEYGAFVGLVSQAGQLLDDGPPIKLRYVRVLDGAGLVHGDFSSGTYLPDGSAYLTGTYVPRLRDVLLIEISDVRYRP